MAAFGRELNLSADCQRLPIPVPGLSNLITSAEEPFLWKLILVKTQVLVHFLMVDNANIAAKEHMFLNHT